MHNKSFEVLKTSPFPFCLDAKLEIVFLSNARGQTRILNQHLWEGDISKLAGGHQNKLFYVFKLSPFPAN